MILKAVALTMTILTLGVDQAHRDVSPSEDDEELPDGEILDYINEEGVDGGISASSSLIFETGEKQ
jgi:hypothetical protein